MSHKLNLSSQFTKREGPVVLVIMDGVGIGKKDESDAVYLANPKALNSMMEQARKDNLYCELKAHGAAVGLPTDDDMGNSEVGHNALGCGQIYSQGAKLVNESLNSGEFFKTQAWNQLIVETAKANKTVHMMGLLSDGNVHSHIDQVFKMIDGLVASGVKRIRLHPLLDGRDVAPDSGLIYIKKLESKLDSLSGIDAKIASGGGRMYLTMDRYYSDWNIVKRGWDAHVLGKVDAADITEEYSGYFKNATEAIEKARQLWPEKKDQFNPPFIIVDDNGNPVGKMEEDDLMINFNYRGDRAIEISEAFLYQKFDGFDRGDFPRVKYTGLLEYDGEKKLPPLFLVPPPTIKNTSTEHLCASGVKSYAIAETHKFGHMTYFWNGNKSGYINEELERYDEVKSDSNERIESEPEMKIYEVTEIFVKEIQSHKHDFLRVNLANGDMVGHTGNIDSCIKAIHAVDECLKKIVDETLKINGTVLVTADHGNAEQKLDKKGKMMTSHTLNPVPFFIVGSGFNGEYKVDISKIDDPGLANVAATFINLLGFNAPEGYQQSLIRKN